MFFDDNKQQETGRGAVCLQACSGWEVSGGYLGFFFLLIIKETSSEWDAQGDMMHFHWVKCLKTHHRYELYLKYLHVYGFSWWSLCSGSFVKFVLSVGDRSYHTCSCLLWETADFISSSLFVCCSCWWHPLVRDLCRYCTQSPELKSFIGMRTIKAVERSCQG